MMVYSEVELTPTFRQVAAHLVSSSGEMLSSKAGCLFHILEM